MTRGYRNRPNVPTILVIVSLVLGYPVAAEAHTTRAAPLRVDATATALHVAPTALSYGLNLEKNTSQLKHFTITNKGTEPLGVTVEAPTDPAYVIVSPPQLSPSGRTISIPAKVPHSTANKLLIEVAFAPPGTGARSATIVVTEQNNTADFSTVHLTGSATHPAQGLWVGGVQYISEFRGQALQQSGDPPANRVFRDSAFGGPYVMAFDPQNNLWVSYQSQYYSPVPIVEISRSQLLAPKHGANLKLKSIIPLGSSGTPVMFTGGYAFDVAGDLWMGDQHGKSIIELLPSQLRKSGSPPVAVSINLQGRTPGVMRFDARNNLWAIVSAGAVSLGNQAWRFAPAERAASGPANPGLMVNLPAYSYYPVDIAFDGSGNLWAAAPISQQDEIEMFSAGDLAGTGEISPSPATTITSANFGSAFAGSCIGGIDFDRSGDLWVSIGTNNADCTAQTQVVEFTPSQLNIGGNLTPTVSVQQNPEKTNLFLNGAMRFGPAL